MLLDPNTSILTKVEDLFIGRSPITIPNKKLKILIVGPEVTPYASVGGFSRVLMYLGVALTKLGHDVRLFMPKFGFLDDREEYEFKMEIEGLKVPTDNPDNPFLVCNVKSHQLPKRPLVYFLENREYYELRANVYGYTDDPIRWALLSRGVIEFLRTIDWTPDVIQANDWQTGWVPNYLRTTYAEDARFQKIATLFTIHNLSYQGMFDHHMVSDLDFDDGKSAIVDFFNPRMFKLNFMRRGIMYSDIVNTVSQSYSKEILREEYGEGLERLLNEVRSKLTGVLNGIDYGDYNPAADKLIAANFDEFSLDNRQKNKDALQLEFDLKRDRSIPIIGYVGRLAEYKGLNLILEILPSLMRTYNVQFVMVGGGDSAIAKKVSELQAMFPNMIGAHLMFDNTLPRLLFAGADIITVPSRFEPCGLPQMEGMRYGAIPLVHETGGLADSVVNYNPEAGTGFGFVFDNYDSYSFFAQVIRALETYRHRDIWQSLQKRAMVQDNSWDARADAYVKLYERSMQANRNRLKNTPLMDEIY